MKNTKLLSVFLVPFLLLTAFSTNSKLTQEGAEKAIKEFIKQTNSSAFASKFSIVEMPSIDSLNQFSETKAGCWVTAKGKVENSGKDSFPIACTHIEAKFKMGFIFQKKADTWILTDLEKLATKRRVSTEYMQKFLKQSGNLKIAAQ